MVLVVGVLLLALTAGVASVALALSASGEDDLRGIKGDDVGQDTLIGFGGDDILDGRNAADQITGPGFP